MILSFSCTTSSACSFTPCNASKIWLSRLDISPRSTRRLCVRAYFVSPWYLSCSSLFLRFSSAIFSNIFSSLPIFFFISSCDTSLRFLFLKRRSSSSFKVTNTGSFWSKLPARASRVFRKVSLSSSASTSSASETLVNMKITSSNAVLSKLVVSFAFSKVSFKLSLSRCCLATR